VTRSWTIYECTVCGEQLRSPLGHHHDYVRAPSRTVQFVEAPVTDEVIERACATYSFDAEMFGLRETMRRVLTEALGPMPIRMLLERPDDHKEADRG
jgi:hypothetical protein